MMLIDQLIQMINLFPDGIVNIEEDDNRQPLYFGVAPKGSADADPVWSLVKISYPSANIIKYRRSPPATVWNNRASISTVYG